jgi:hypothetical protein
MMNKILELVVFSQDLLVTQYEGRLLAERRIKFS